MVAFLSRRQLLTGAVLAPLLTAARADDYFPANPYSAPFPSPAGSTVPGRPYLRDKFGEVVTLDLVHRPTHYYTAPETPGAAAGYYVLLNGVNISSDHGPGIKTNRWTTIYFTLLVIDNSGLIKGESADGNWWYFAAGGWHLTKPPEVTRLAAATMPPDPPRAAVAPGSSGRVIRVGPAQRIKTITQALARAAAGDTLALDAAIFHEGFVVSRAIHFKGTPATASTPGTVISGAGLALSAYPMRGRGGVVPATDCTFDDIEFTGWGLLSKRADLTSAIRPMGRQWLTCNRCHFTGNQCGIGTDGGGTPNNIVTLNDCTADNNGLGDGRSHSYYFGNDTVRIVSNRSSSTAPRGGHALKSRAWDITIIGGTFDASDATPIDIPDGTAAPFSISGATINKGAADKNHGVLSYAAESTSNGAAGGAVNARINALCASPFVQVNAGIVSFVGSTFTGNRVTAQAPPGAVVGLA